MTHLPGQGRLFHTHLLHDSPFSSYDGPCMTHPPGQGRLFHIHLLHTAGIFRLKKSARDFATIDALLAHYGNPDNDSSLPCPLRLHDDDDSC